VGQILRQRLAGIRFNDARLAFAERTGDFR
jgi:hypothetical protein